MPFQNLEIDIASLPKRDFNYIIRTMEAAFSECNKFSPAPNSELVRIMNSKTTDPKKANPKDFLALLGLKKGLNWAEIEWWFDNPAQNKGKYHFHKDFFLWGIDENRIYYIVPGTFLQSSHIAYLVSKVN